MGNLVGDIFSGITNFGVNTVGGIFTGTAQGTTKAMNQLGKEFSKVGEQFDSRKANEVNYRNASDGIRSTANVVGGITGALAGWKLGEAFGKEGQTACAVAMSNLTRNAGNVVAEIGEDFCAANDYVREASAKGVNVSRARAFLSNLGNLGTHTYDGAIGSELTLNSKNETIVTPTATRKQSRISSLLSQLQDKMTTSTTPAADKTNGDDYDL